MISHAPRARPSAEAPARSALAVAGRESCFESFGTVLAVVNQSRSTRGAGTPPPAAARPKTLYMHVMMSSHHTTMYERALSRSTHDLKMISLDCPSPLQYPAQATASQQRAALLLHDAEVGDDGPDDEKDEEQAS